MTDLTRRRALALALLPFLVACGDRWWPNHPRMLRYPDGVAAYDAVHAVLGQYGYIVRVDDPERLYVQAIAKVDSQQGDPDKMSFISFQGYQDGSLMITAHGRHVKEEKNVVHRKLHAELEQLANALGATGQRMQ